jgi:hypothetical protein
VTGSRELGRKPGRVGRWDPQGEQSGDGLKNRREAVEGPGVQARQLAVGLAVFARGQGWAAHRLAGPGQMGGSATRRRRPGCRTFCVMAGRFGNGASVCFRPAPPNRLAPKACTASQSRPSDIGQAENERALLGRRFSCPGARRGVPGSGLPCLDWWQSRLGESGRPMDRRLAQPGQHREGGLLARVLPVPSPPLRALLALSAPSADHGRGTMTALPGAQTAPPPYLRSV